jgi:hypothetical protein
LVEARETRHHLLQSVHSVALSSAETETIEVLMLKFLLGLSLGYGLGLLIAPAPGEETRRELRERSAEKVADVVEMGRERAGQIGREAGQKAFDEAAKRTVGENIVDRSRHA